MKRVFRYPELIVVTLAAALTRFWDVFTPNAIVFDEVYFKVFAGHYLDGRYFFDIHPPLTKLLLAGWAGLLHLPASEVLTGTAVGMRLLPALAGTLIIPVFWGLLRRLGATRVFAALGASLLLLDNALTVESRFILTDPVLILFGLTSVWAYLSARGAKAVRRWAWLALAGLAGGAAITTKWTGAASLAVVGIAWLMDEWPVWKNWQRHAGELAVLVGIPIVIYISAFAVHFALLSKSGDGDPFMSQRFQATLVGSATYDPSVKMSFWEKLVETNVEMYTANSTLTAGHPYSSKWYTWPFMARGVYYWEGEANAKGAQGNIYLLGNPLLWWGIPLAILSGFLWLSIKRRRVSDQTKAALVFLTMAFVLNLAPFAAVPRVMFLYHYFFCLIYSLAAAILLWQDIASHAHSYATVKRWAVVVFLIVLAGFLYFVPLTYGLPLTPNELQAHMWLKTWR